MSEPILITGCARSGTSLVAGIINVCGGFGGAMTGEMGHNPKGQFENWYLRDHVEKPILSFYDSDPMGQHPLPDTENMQPTPLLKEIFYLVMMMNGWSGQQIFYKGAKMCLMWPVWDYAFPNAHWLIVRRNAKDIAKSCMNTSFMNAYKDEIGWFKWIEQHEKRFEQMYQNLNNVSEVWADDLIAGDLEPIKKFIMNFDDLEWDEGEVLDFIDPDIWKRWSRS